MGQRLVVSLESQKDVMMADWMAPMMAVLMEEHVAAKKVIWLDWKMAVL
jgi:hypothetical protein